MTGLVLVLVFVGMLLGVGVLTLDQFGRAVRTTTTQVDAGKNLSGATLSTTLTKTYCIAITSIDNGTNSFSLTTYNVTLRDKDTCSYTATNLPCSVPYCNITYTYGLETVATTTLTDTNSAITPIAQTWLPLVVTVAILSIILTIVIASFAMKRE